MKKNIIIGIVIVIIILLATGAFIFFNNREDSPKFKIDKATTGDIKATVTATGTMNAVVTVLVGTQVSGTIKTLYVDFNSPVKKDQILAQIDPATFQAQVGQAKANLLLAKANVEKAEAALVDAKRTMERNRVLFTRNFIARSDLDTAETNHQSAAAQLSASKAQVEQAKAALDFAETNLRYTRIVSPVNGIVISRNVDVGQTVAASFQTPTLFNIAQDLTKMQIDTNVDEADIGKIKMGQPVEFTVDAYSDTTFMGKVSEVRNAPTTIQNVVTYNVVVKVENPELKLKPGMTANVSIILSDKKGVLRIPNAALRFRPAERGTERGKEAPVQKGPGVWVLENRKPKRISVALGISDGNYTEILTGDVKEGDEVIVEAAGGGKKSNTPPVGPGFIR
ncbi:MAG TPA: efflux RND transporter periplasmic adaptor subunit [Thermodesulfovibrionales bacterium]|nr:efflux RND transporter periplasmic adaptor subunit [Thermodesulfovibrionales bacterium]